MKKVLLSVALAAGSLVAAPEVHKFENNAYFLLQKLEACRPQYEELRTIGHGHVWAASTTYSSAQRTQTWELTASTLGHPLSMQKPRQLARLTITQVWESTGPADGEPFSKIDCKLQMGDAKAATFSDGKVENLNVYTNYLIGALEECREDFKAFSSKGYAVSPEAYTYDRGGHTESYALKAVVLGHPLTGPGYDVGTFTVTRTYDYSKPIPADGPVPYKTSCKANWLDPKDIKFPGRG
jgi:hypothetical protein